MTDPIVSFYSGSPDDRGRTLDEILAWDDDRLEAVHDYIQWVFPTVQPSAVNPYAPLVTTGTVSAFQIQPPLRLRLGRALGRMLRFYGLRRAGSASAQPGIEVDPERFPARSATWLHPGNHNHLRLTRIMQSLAALGLHDDAVALQRCLLEDVARGPGLQQISRTTLAYWRSALEV
jgi:opioid growth factor receptor-like protein